MADDGDSMCLEGMDLFTMVSNHQQQHVDSSEMVSDDGYASESYVSDEDKSGAQGPGAHDYIEEETKMVESDTNTGDGFYRQTGEQGLPSESMMQVSHQKPKAAGKKPRAGSKKLRGRVKVKWSSFRGMFIKRTRLVTLPLRNRVQTIQMCNKQEMRYETISKHIHDQVLLGTMQRLSLPDTADNLTDAMIKTVALAVHGWVLLELYRCGLPGTTLVYLGNTNPDEIGTAEDAEMQEM
jgi:hypothetical protein